MSRHVLSIKLALDHDLGGNARVVGAWNENGIVAAHAMVADQSVHDGLVKGMPHVQGAGDIGRGELNGERLA